MRWGGDRPLDRIGARELERAALEAWGATAPAMWNRHVATLRSFDGFCRRRGWLQEAIAGGLERRREPVDRTRSIPYVQRDRLWRRDDVAAREKALWRLLYETADRAQEVLSLNVEDVDLENKRARVRSKGGDTEWLHLQSGSARLLPRLIAGRARGPVFLADRRPAPARTPAAGDLCPSTGRGRLSYRRAEELFCAGVGWLDAAPAAPFGDHASGRGRRRTRVADGQEPPYLIAFAAALCPPGPRGGCETDRRPRSRAPSVVSW